MFSILNNRWIAHKEDDKAPFVTRAAASLLLDSLPLRVLVDLEHAVACVSWFDRFPQHVNEDKFDWIVGVVIQQRC